MFKELQRNLIEKKKTVDSEKTFVVLEAGIKEKLEFRTALKRIFGLGLVRFDQLNKLYGITTRRTWKYHEIPNIDSEKLDLYLPGWGLFGVSLMKVIAAEKEKYLELRCYKRNRFLLGFPANGQRTRSNGRTARKFRIK